MNKKIIVGVVIVLIVVIAGVVFYSSSSSSTLTTTPPVVLPDQTVPIVSDTASTSQVLASSTVSNKQSSGDLFSKYKYFSKAHEIFPVLAADTKKALGAFSYTKTDLGNNVYKFTLVNNAEGYKGQSVVVSSDQSVYFIEPALGDDSTSEDSVTTDDLLVAVDAQGNILK
ncbi:TPA: hypothetical protein DCQ44_01855 [Candidatus Taylorbacteria bacterium]|nr:hypothetical protein [Candidatus Taylorbacteria bacterium]